MPRDIASKGFSVLQAQEVMSNIGNRWLALDRSSRVVVRALSETLVVQKLARFGAPSFVKRRCYPAPP